MQSKFSRTTDAKTGNLEKNRCSDGRNVWLSEACERLRSLKQLRAGWDSHGGEAPDPKVIEGAVALLTKLDDVADFLFSKPYVYATPAGGVQFEWESPGQYFEIECVSATEAHAYFQDREARVEEEHPFHYDDSLEPVLKYLGRLARTA